MTQNTTLKAASENLELSVFEDLKQKIDQCRAHVAVVGLGYVGIPLAIAFADQKFNVIGYDVDANRVRGLAEGKSPIGNIPSDSVKRAVDAGQFVTTNQASALAKADVIIICVPTPLTKQREPDMTYITNTVETIGQTLRKGQMVILESTTYPGTTKEIVLPMLEQSTGLKSGEDFFVAFSPEREDPGNMQHSVITMPKVVGGEGEGAIALASALYGKISQSVVPVSSTATAEAVKLTENIFRAVNIALVNELKIVYTAMGIDVWEVINAAKTKPFGYMPFYPGPGLGGHCIPIDPFYLTWKAREFDISTRFIELAGEVNAAMPKYVVDILAETMGTRFRKSLTGSRVLLIGLAYKKNVEDMRESPALKVMDLLVRHGAEVDYHDPYVLSVPDIRHYPQFKDKSSIDLQSENIKNYDAVMIVTDHDNVDYKRLADQAKLIIDTRNVMDRLGISSENIVKA